MNKSKFIKWIIVTPYWTPVVGGVTTFGVSLKKSLSKNSDVHVSVITWIGEKEKNVYAINSKKIIFAIKSFFIIWKRSPDVLHSQSWWYTLAPCVLYKLLNPRCYLIHTLHTDPIVERKKSFSMKIKRKVSNWLINKTDVVSFVSRNMLEKYSLMMCIKTKTKVIYNGVSKGMVNQNEIGDFKKSYCIKNNHPIISWIGPFSNKNKIDGLKRLIEAFKLVTANYPDARLLIIGDGDLRDELEILVNNLNLNKNVIFTGFLDNVFVSHSIIDIYTHISFQEGCPLAILEAMSAGKPVIASKVGGIPELIVDGKTGILVNSDSLSIADAILNIYTNKSKMKEIGNNARREVEANFNWDIVAKNFKKLIM